MARIQYQPATKPRGFQPIQLSRAGIARMEEEGNRVIRNLEQQRDATNNQRRDDLQAMQANSAYENQARERNQRTLEANIKQEQIAAENERKFKIAEADRKSKNIESAVNGLLDFSTTLAKQAGERTKQMIEDQTAEGAQFRRQEYLNSPELQSDFATVESQVSVQTEILDQNTIQNGAKGFDSSLETAKNLAANPGRGYYWKKGYYNELIIEQTPLLVNRALQGTENIFTDQAGNKFSGIEAAGDPDKMRIVLGQVQNSLYGSTGLNINSLEPGFLEKSNKFVDEFTSTSIQRASATATQNIYKNLTLQAGDLMDQGRVADGYRLLLKIPSVGREGALNKVFDLYSAQNADGTFRYSVDELNSIKLLGDKTILEERGNSQRYQNAIAARRKALSDYRRDDAAFTKQEAKDFANKALPQMIEYFESANAQGDLAGAATFEKEFYEKYPNQSLPSSYVRAKQAALKGNYDAEVATIQARARTQTLDKEFVDAIESPKLQLAAIKALKEQEAAKYGPKYATMKKSLLSEAKTLTKFDPTVEGPGSGTTIMVTNALKNEYTYFFKSLVDKGVPVDAAADQAYTQLKDYIAKAATDKTNIFYKETGALNTPIFPKIQGTTQTLSASSQEQRNKLNKLILKNNANVGSIFSMPNAVLSETQIETTINSYYANDGTFRIPLAVQYASPLAKTDPITAINEQIQASNEKHGKNRRLLTPSPVEEAIFDQVPSVQKLFTDFEKMSTTRLSRGTAYLTRTAGPMRASMSSQSTGVSGQISGNGYEDTDGQDTGVNIELFGPQGLTGKTGDHQSKTGAYGGRRAPIATPFELTFNEFVPGGRNAGAKSITTQGSTDRVVKGTAPGGFGHIGSYTYTDENGDQYEIMLAHGDQPFNSFKEGQVIPAGTLLGYQGASGSSDDGAGGGYDHISLHVNSYGNGDPNRIIRLFTESLIN